MTARPNFVEPASKRCSGVVACISGVHVVVINGFDPSIEAVIEVGQGFSTLLCFTSTETDRARFERPLYLTSAFRLSWSENEQERILKPLLCA